MKKSFYFFLCFSLSIQVISCTTNTRNTECGNKYSLNYISSKYGCTYFETFKSDSIGSNPNLVILLHGDAPFNPPSYHNELGEILQNQTKNTISVAILRPGYEDSEGNRSEGIKGNTTGDNYTRDVVDNLIEVIKRLKERYQPNQVLIVGHSGGAAIAADILSLSTNLIDQTILVSCPCDVESWRKYMSSKQPYYKFWKESVQSISPITIADSLPSNSQIILLHGLKDDVVPFGISNMYYQKLKSKNKDVEIIKIENGGHEIFLSDIVINTIKKRID